MHGNVLEWCDDWYTNDLGNGEATDPTGPTEGEDRVLRGGSWSNFARYCRSADRFYRGPGRRDFDVGFRLSRGQWAQGLQSRRKARKLVAAGPRGTRAGRHGVFDLYLSPCRRKGEQRLTGSVAMVCSCDTTDRASVNFLNSRVSAKAISCCERLQHERPCDPSQPSTTYISSRVAYEKSRPFLRLNPKPRE